jgi:hypothetical protein
MLTVACVYRPGGGFNEDYVLRLKDSVTKYSYVHDRFVCLTNEKIDNVECIKLKNNWQGWWSKLELFKLRGRVAYFDLDTMIVGDISDVISCEAEFAALSDFNRPEHLASGVMVFNGDAGFDYITDAFSPRLAIQYTSFPKWGDQGFIADHLRVPFTSLQQEYPERIVSYKKHVRPQGFVPREASIVCFHGKPRPAQLEWTLPPRA